MTTDSGGIEAVRLKNGSEVPHILVQSTMVLLEALMGEEPFAFFELVESCRDREHVIFGNLGEKLQTYSLIEDLDGEGRAIIHDSTRHIVLSAVGGEGLNLQLTSPIAS